MSGVVNVAVGAVVGLKDEQGKYFVRRFEDATTVQLENAETGKLTTCALSKLEPVTKAPPRDRIELGEVKDEAWEVAKARWDTVNEVESAGGGVAAVDEAAVGAGVNRATVYRWIKTFAERGLVTDLYRKRRADAGVKRLSEAVEAILNSVIVDYHLTEEKRRISATYKELERLCKIANEAAPSIETLKARIGDFDQSAAARARGDSKRVHKLRLNRGRIQGADYPYSLIQIDHTLVDIQLVDEVDRIPIGRPWITIAIDVDSRMCAGYYISFDPPGTLGTGMCLSHAFLDKQKWMRELGVDYRYPCQGIPTIIHCDNAKEFRGNTLRHACEKYGTKLKFRNVKKPQHGAHIERLNGTLMREIHALKGTTFSNSGDKGDYDSAKHASMTLKEFERWFANLVLGDYHNRPHSGINNEVPLQRYIKGIVGDNGARAGSIAVATDEEELYYDFLPMDLLTIQQYGIQWDLIQYTQDVLRRWVGAMDPQHPNRKRKFIVRRDPRDISALFFFDPEARKYFRIPYRNLENPHISVWELKAIRAYLREVGRDEVDEAAIFKARNEMRKIEETSAAKTQKAKRSRAQTKAIRRQESPQPKFGKPGVEKDAAGAGDDEADDPEDQAADDQADPQPQTSAPDAYDEIERY